MGTAVESIADRAGVDALAADRARNTTPSTDTDGPVAGLVDSVGELVGPAIQRSPIKGVAGSLRQSLSDDVRAPLLRQSVLGAVADALAPALSAVPLPAVNAPLPTPVDAVQPPSGSAPMSLAIPDDAMPADPTIAGTASPVRGVSASSSGHDGALAIEAIDPSFGNWTTGVPTHGGQSVTAVPLDSPAPARSGPVGASGSASAGGFAPLPVLAALLLAALVAPLLRSVPKEAPAFLRPAPYIALLERPG